MIHICILCGSAYLISHDVHLLQIETHCECNSTSDITLHVENCFSLYFAIRSPYRKCKRKFKSIVFHVVSVFCALCSIFFVMKLMLGVM
jgi:hypothetical protein